MIVPVFWSRGRLSRSMNIYKNLHYVYTKDVYNLCMNHFRLDYDINL